MRLAILLVLSAGIFFTNLGNPLGLHQNDEDFYLGVSQTMVESGDWIVPMWDGQPAFMKPPLLNWMAAASMRVLGSSLFAARLPVALIAILTALVTAALARRLLDSEALGDLAGLVTVTTLGFLQYGRVVMMDVPLALCLVCAVWACWRATQGEAWAPYAFFTAVAAGILLKGPATALVPLGGAALWLILGRRVDTAASALAWRHVLGGMALFVLLIGVWPLALYTRGMFDLFYAQFIVGENLGKFGGEPYPVTRMVTNYLMLLLPWTLCIGGAFVTYVFGRRTAPAAMLALCFAFSNLVVYSIPAIKWAQYLLPSLPLLAIFMVWAASERADATDGAFSSPLAVPLPIRIGAVVTGLVFGGIAPVLAMGARIFPEWTVRLPIFVVALGLLFTAVSLLAGTRLYAAASGFAVVLIGVGVLAPMLSLERLPAEVATQSSGHPLMTYGVPPYGYQLMLGRSVGVCSVPPEFRARFQDGVYFIVGDSELRALMQAGAFDPTRAEMLTCWRKWRRQMNPGVVAEAIFRGSLQGLTENVCLMRLRPLNGGGSTAAP